MILKRTALLIAAAVLVWAMSQAEPTAAQSQGPNLLTNPGFEEGHYSQGGVSELTVPNGWRLHYLDGAAFPGSNGVAYRPESVVWNIADGPPEERTLFWRDGIYTLKVFKGWAPMYAALSQDVTGLETGRRYRLTAPIYVDIVTGYDGGKVPPERLDTGMVRLGAGSTGAAWRDENAIRYSGWWTGENVSPFYFAYPIFVYEFTATEPNMTVWIEFASKEPHPNNGFFMDTLGLYALDAVAAPPPPAPPQPGTQPQPAPAAPAGPTPTPRADGSIVHVVQSGDTLWGIAIQYASTLGVTAEQALNTIRDLNNNPSFINVGQEILVAPPSPAAVAAAAVPETVTDATEDAEEGVELAQVEAGDEPAEEVEPTPEPEPTVTPATANTICVVAFNDDNGNGAFDQGSENLLADAVFTLSRSAGTVATYVSDGLNEPYCFENLEADSYQVNFSQPADYKATTPGNWAIALSGGMTVPVEFGAQYSPIEIAATGREAAAPEENAPATNMLANDVTGASGGFFSNLGAIVLAVAVALVLLAGVGVYILRRS